MTKVLEINPTGLLKVFNEKDMERIKLFLNIQEDNTIKVQFRVKDRPLYTALMHTKPEMGEEFFVEVEDKQLKIDYEHFDNARTTPSFAKYYNNVFADIITETLDNDETTVELVYPMKSYADGYNFVGEAFVHLVTALIAYHRDPNGTTDTLTKYANMIRSNIYLSATSITHGLSKYMAIHKNIVNQDKRMMKSMANVYKGMVGGLYRSNDMQDIPYILQYIKDTLVPESNINFVGDRKNKVVTYVMLAMGGFLLGSMFTYCMMAPHMSHPNECLYTFSRNPFYNDYHLLP